MKITILLLYITKYRDFTYFFDKFILPSHILTIPPYYS